MVVNSNVTPVVTISISPNDTVCQGTVVTFTPSAVYGGTAPVYSWLVNGTPRATGSTYAYAPANGDVVFCQMTSSYACVLTNTALSNNIHITVDDNTLPVVSITVNTGANVGGVVYGDTMTAIVTNGSLDQRFQWSVNGSPVTGATNATYIASSLNNGDAVSCVVMKINSCGALIGSGVVIVTSSNVGVQPVVVTTAGDIRLVPNPNKGLFTLKGSLGTTGDQEVSIEVTDMIGQVVYTGKAIAHNGVVDETVKLTNVANGMYMLNFHSGNENKVFHMVIEQ
jgi:hypothetical protein